MLVFSQIQDITTKLNTLNSDIVVSKADCCRLESVVETAESRFECSCQAKQNADAALETERMLQRDLEAELEIHRLTNENKRLCKRRNNLRKSLKQIRLTARNSNAWFE